MAINKYLLITIFIFSSFFLLHAEDASAATYYASPSGGGNGSSQSSPFQIANFWPIAKPGDTLLLLDGAYTGANSMITPPTSVDGISDNPITIKSLNDGKVLINGQNSREPIILSGNDYIIIDGVNASNSNWHVVQISSSINSVIRRVIVWNANPNANSASFVIANGANGTLLEDIAAWGLGRKQIVLISDIKTTVRRCFTMWSGHTTAGGTARDGINTGYYSSSGSNSNVIENCIATWDQTWGSSSGEEIAIIGGGATDGGTPKLFGNIAYALNSQNGIFIGAFWFKRYSDVDMTDSIAYLESNYSNDDTIYIEGGSSPTSNYVTTIGGLSPSGGIITNSLRNPSISSIGGDILQYNKTSRPSSGAWIKYRYVNGELNNQPLWPWPMNERIKEAMVTSGYDKLGGLDGNGGIDLQKAVFELGGGTCPSEICGSTPPPPPPPPTCTSFTYSAWSPSTCPSSQTQTRTVTSSSPSGCAGGTPITTQSCVYTPPSPGSTNPTVHFKLDEGSGAIITDSIGNKNGTLINNPLWTTGKLNKAIFFDETDDHIIIPNIAYNQDLTLSFWFKTSDNTGTSYQYLFNHGSFSTNNSLNIYFVEESNGSDINPGALRTIMRDSNDILDFTALDLQSGLSDNQWHHYTLTVNQNTGSTVYIDGVQKMTAQLGGDSFNPSSNIYIGGREDLSPDRFYGGSIDDIKIFNRALTAQEIQTEYNTTSNTPTLLGDLNGDGTVNTLDWSIMNSKWNTADPQADLNNDGVVNTLDWSIMNSNWTG